LLFDPKTETYLDWKFDISGYTGHVEPLNGMVTPANSSLQFSGAGNSRELVLTYVSDEVFLGLSFAVPLTSSGIDVPVIIATNADAAHFNSFDADGRGTVSSVPEPVAGVVVLAVATILCISKRLRPRRPASTNMSKC
jgi:hypothetical protein